MSKLRLTFASYEVRLAAPLITAKRSIRSRSGFLIALCDPDGNLGIGEAAPLPAFGTETVDEAAEALTSLASIGLPNLPVESSEIPEWLQSCALSPYTQPAVSFAVECAIAAIVSHRSSKPLYQLLTPGAPDTICVNGLVSADNESTLLTRVRTLVDSGVETVKIKVGAQPVKNDVTAIQSLRSEFATLNLRADANSAWNFAEAEEFCRGTQDANLQYVEDPLAHANAHSLKVLHNQYGTRFAADDSSRDDVWRTQRITGGAFHVLIVKPSLTGLTTRTPKLVSLAGENRMEVVFTSLLESSVGLQYIAHSAAAYGSPGMAHGVDTASLLAEDTLSHPLHARRAALKLSDVYRITEQLRPDIKRALGLA